MTNLKEQFYKTMVPDLKKRLNCKNIHEVPRIEKVVVNVGLGSGLKDQKYKEAVEDTLRRITGQKPLETKARKSISNFKIREGQIVGAKVTLRGRRMYDFVSKLVNIALPRIRDFRGISTKLVDQNGNMHIGFREHISFPEISTDEVERIHGLEVTIVTSAKNHENGLELFRAFGFPFHEDDSQVKNK